MKILPIVFLLLLQAPVMGQESLWKMYVDSGSKAYEEKRYQEAERRLDLARKEAESFGARDPRLAKTLCKLALVYVQQDRMPEVMRVSTQALGIWERADWEKAKETEPLEAANSLLNLAGALLDKKEYAHIEVLLNRALEVEKTVLPATHPAIGRILYYLAITNHVAKKSAEAQSYVRRAVPIFKDGEKIIDHKEILDVLRGASTIDPSRAETYLNEALEFRAKNLEPEHYDVETLDLLGRLYLDQRKYENAEQALTRSLQFTKKAYGPADSRVVLAIKKLADMYAAAEEYAKAQAAYNDALAALERTPGDTRGLRFQLLNGLQGVYQEIGKYAEAEPLVEEGLKIVEDVLGIKDPVFANYLNVKGMLLMDLEKYNDAEPILQRVLNLRKDLLKVDDSDLIASYNTLAKNYYYQGKYEEAKPLYLTALDALRKKDPSSVTLIWYTKNYALLLYALGHAAEGESLFLSSLEAFAKNQDQNSVFLSWYELAELYRRQKKYREAEPLYKRALALMEKSGQQNRPKFVTALKKYASLLRETGRYSEALQLETRAKETQSNFAAKP